IARMKADGRLVQNVEHAAKARSYLRGQADALGFPAGKRGGGTIEAQVPEAHSEQKIDTFSNFFKGASSDFLLARRKLQDNFGHRGPRGGKRERGEIGDGPAGKLYGERFWT